MSNKEKVKVQQGFPFFAILGLIFITLKLTGHITWSWWLVLLPLYGPVVLALGIVAVALVVVLLTTSITAIVTALTKK